NLSCTSLKRLPVKRILAAVFAVSFGLCGCGGGGGSVPTASSQAQIAVSPATPQVRAGGTQQFTAQVSNASGTVTWAVNGTAGGSPTLGTIDANGLYIAPATLPSPNTVTISASLAGNVSLTASTVATLLNPVPAIITASVTGIVSGDYAVAISGSGFVPGT